ncbi:MAG: GyrI-like domain-containing protein [Chloroflexota bacterium]
MPAIWEMDYYCRTMYEHLYGRLGELGIPTIEPELTLYHAEEYHETDLDVEAAVAVETAVLQGAPVTDDLAFRDLPAEEVAACLLYEGPFLGVESAVLELMRWIAMHEHVIAGPLRELHLSGPAHVNGCPVDNAVVELQLPVVPAD